MELAVILDYWWNIGGTCWGIGETGTILVEHGGILVELGGILVIFGEILVELLVYGGACWCIEIIGLWLGCIVNDFKHIIKPVAYFMKKYCLSNGEQMTI